METPRRKSEGVADAVDVDVGVVEVDAGREIGGDGERKVKVRAIWMMMEM